MINYNLYFLYRVEFKLLVSVIFLFYVFEKGLLCSPRLHLLDQSKNISRTKADSRTFVFFYPLLWPQ